MRLVEILLPQMLALASGAAVVRCAFPRGAAGWLATLGYGYVVGLMLGAIALFLSGVSGIGVRFIPAAAILVVLAVLAGLVMRRVTARDRDLVVSSKGTKAGGIMLAVTMLIVAALLIRVLLVGAEAVTRPLYPWDAWQQWGTKARVWFETQQLKPFVDKDEWLRISPDSKDAVYTDANPNYPPLVPLIQVWSLGSSTAWNDATIGVTWPVLLAALGLALIGQIHRILAYWPFALGVAYMALSLPILDTHAALAGYADLPLAVIYTLAFMAAASWVRFRRRGDAAVAILLLLAMPVFKRPGIAWAATFVPFLVFLIPQPRRELAMRGTVYAALLLALVLIVFRLLGGHGAEAGEALQSVVLNLFAWENWHLLWYLAILLLAMYAGRPRSAALAGAGATLALGAAFLAAAFFGMSLAASISDTTTLNRALMPLGPAVCYFLALLVHRDVRRLAWRQAAQAEAPVPGEPFRR